MLSPTQMAFVSLGKNGSLMYQNGVKEIIPTIYLTPVDTTGAGDAFYSYVLYSLDKKENNYHTILKKANFVGAMATQNKGAIDVVPTIKQIENYMEEFN